MCFASTKWASVSAKAYVFESLCSVLVRKLQYFVRFWLALFGSLPFSGLRHRLEGH